MQCPVLDWGCRRSTVPPCRPTSCAARRVSFWMPAPPLRKRRPPLGLSQGNAGLVHCCEVRLYRQSLLPPRRGWRGAIGREPLHSAETCSTAASAAGSDRAWAAAVVQNLLPPRTSAAGNCSRLECLDACIQTLSANADNALAASLSLHLEYERPLLTETGALHSGHAEFDGGGL